jgi:hypothetical protein
MLGIDGNTKETKAHEKNGRRGDSARSRKGHRVGAGHNCQKDGPSAHGRGSEAEHKASEETEEAITAQEKASEKSGVKA